MSAVFTTVRGYLEAHWDQNEAALTWENEEFQPPTSLRAWIYVANDDSDYEQQSIGAGSPGANRWRETGALLLYVNVPTGSGTLLIDQLIIDLRTMLKGLYLPDGTWFESMPTVGRGRGDDGNWYEACVRAAWIRDDPA